MDETYASLASRFTRFAATEASGRSPSYETLARSVAADREVLDFLMTLPAGKRQPNLLLAAMRHLFGTSPTWDHFRRALLVNPDAVRSVMLTHSTQTNEPARCATLLPVLALLTQPLALIEVGASAGLCLLPDFYGYEYGCGTIRPARIETAPPVFTCCVNETTPIPTAMPEIIWRAGLDLNPLDAADPAQAAWLETLVWPEQTDRLARLQAALRIAASHKPRVIRGDLLDDSLTHLCKEAPRGATLVIFHTAVLAYVPDPSNRQAFADRAMSLCQYWISNEAPSVFPRAASYTGTIATPGRFLLSVNEVPVAWTDPHGVSLEWIASQKPILVGRQSDVGGRA